MTIKIMCRKYYIYQYTSVRPYEVVKSKPQHPPQATPWHLNF